MFCVWSDIFKTAHQTNMLTGLCVRTASVTGLGIQLVHLQVTCGTRYMWYSLHVVLVTCGT
jgi:hypothetical protein